MARSEKPLVIDGIEVNLTAEDFDDFEILECLADMIDETAEQSAKVAATVRVYRLLFGPDLGRIKRELRAKHGGKLANEVMGDFLNSCMTAANAKN